MKSMILDEHPDDRNQTRGMKAIGYWKSSYEPDLPDPRDFIDEGWDKDERDKVAFFLDHHEPLLFWRGYSSCRFGCQDTKNNHSLWLGSTCRSDGSYVWPEGFSHYIRFHSVRPPQEFIEHALKGFDDILKAKDDQKEKLKKNMEGMKEKLEEFFLPAEKELQKDIQLTARAKIINEEMKK